VDQANGPVDISMLWGGGSAASLPSSGHHTDDNEAAGYPASYQRFPAGELSTG
jgi:hypothetical protein